MPTQKKSTTKTAATKPAPKKSATAKAVTKKAVIKSAPKKKASQKNEKVMKSAGLVCATDEQCFWTTDGRVLKSLEDLVFAFGSMEETIFVYHANEAKNDFAEWVEHVLEDKALAKDLRKTKTPKRAHTVTKKRLKSYG